MSAVVRVGRRYTIVIPKEVRERVRLKEGSRLLVRVKGRSIILEPLPEDPFKVLERVIGEPYEEEKESKRAVEWLVRNARC